MWGGGVHSPNVDGIKWFAKSVMPYLDNRVVLNIVGANMDKHKNAPEFINNPRIQITGRVDSLDPYYNSADLVIGPIFYGAGMMTKTAEALMYGKNYIATAHALHGYEGLDGCRCDTAEEFITRINNMAASGTERFNPSMRKLYEDKYSITAMENTLRKFFRQKKLM